MNALTVKLRGNKQIDMTEGHPAGLLAVFAVPIFLGNVFQQFYSIVDSVIVGRFVGADALAAVGVSASPYSAFVSMSMGLSSGIGIVMSQLFGGRKEDCMKQTVVNAFFIIICSSMAAGAAGFCAAPGLLRLLGTPDAIFGQALVYMRILFIGVPGMAVYNCVAGILRALGDSRASLYFLVFSSIMNIILDVIFVTMIPLGVFGVGLATLLGQLFSAAAIFCHARKKYDCFTFGRSDLRLDRAVIKRLLLTGVPLGLQSTTICLSATALQGFVNGFGESVIAAQTVIVKFDNILNMPLNSFSLALSTFTGQNAGAHRKDRIHHGYRAALAIAAVYSLLVFVAGHTCGNVFMHLFVRNEPEVIAYGIRGIAIYSSAVLSLGMIYINRSVLNGIGDTGFALFNGVVEIIGRVGFATLFISVLGTGPEGLWYTAIANWTLTGAVCFARYLYRCRTIL